MSWISCREGSVQSRVLRLSPFLKLTTAWHCCTSVAAAPAPIVGKHLKSFHSMATAPCCMNRFLTPLSLLRTGHVGVGPASSHTVFFSSTQNLVRASGSTWWDLKTVGWDRCSCRVCVCVFVSYSKHIRTKALALTVARRGQTAFFISSLVQFFIPDPGLVLGMACAKDPPGHGHLCLWGKRGLSHGNKAGCPAWALHHRFELGLLSCWLCRASKIGSETQLGLVESERRKNSACDLP